MLHGVSYKTISNNLMTNVSQNWQFLSFGFWDFLGVRYDMCAWKTAVYLACTYITNGFCETSLCSCRTADFRLMWMPVRHDLNVIRDNLINYDLQCILCSRSPRHFGRFCFRHIIIRVSMASIKKKLKKWPLIPTG